MRNNATGHVIYFPTYHGALALTSDVEAIKNYPIGALIIWPQATPPEGYFICEGQDLDKVKLAQAYPSGKLSMNSSEVFPSVEMVLMKVEQY
ncbi:MAG: hypothetical protein ACL7BU_06035 [Candidatus Phlomobacter fragariae]